MRELTVLYDAQCPTCARARDWLATRAQLVSLVFVPAGSTRARALFPGLNHERTLRDITVVSDDGKVFTGEKAWVICLWALRGYRKVAAMMTSPALWPLARSVIGGVSGHVARQHALRELTALQHVENVPDDESEPNRCEC